MLMSFCGSGFLGIYHLGVAEAFVAHGRDLLGKIVNFSGASSGALVAAWMTIKEPNHKNIQICKEFCFEVAENSRKQRLGILSPHYSLLKDVERFISEVAPNDAYQVANGKLHISLTKANDKKNCMVSHFSSNEHLLQCLLASCSIPYVTGKETIHIDKEKYIDGGFSDNLPTMCISSDHITVSPFCGQQDICPEDKSLWKMHLTFAKQDFKVNSKNLLRGYHTLFPPNNNGMQMYFNQGYQDGIRFLRKKGFYT